MFYFNIGIKFKKHEEKENFILIFKELTINS